MRMKSSIARWFDEPLPAEATLIWLALLSPAKRIPDRFETGVFGAAVSTIGTDWIGADRDEILHRVVVLGLPHRRARGDGAARAEQQRVAVGGRLRHRRAADGAGGAGAVLDDHLLAERFAERGRDGARGDVDVAARRPGHDDAHRA